MEEVDYPESPILHSSLSSAILVDPLSIPRSPSYGKASLDDIREKPIFRSISLHPIDTDDTIDALIEKDTEEEVREGGITAWLVVLASFINHFIVNGSQYAFGVFLSYYSKELYPDASQTMLTMIGTLSSASLSLFGLLTGRFADRYGYRQSMALGYAFVLSGHVLASFSTQPWQLLLTQGLLCGIGSSFTYVPAVSAPSQWFQRRRGMAVGIAVAGSGLGGFALNPGADWSIRRFGVAWTLRGLAVITAVIGCIALILLKPHPGAKEMKAKAKASKGWRSMFAFGMFRDIRFVALFWTGFMSSLGQLIPFFLLPSYALSVGLNAAQGALLVGVLNGSSALGRVGMGVVADAMGRVLSLFMCLVGSGLACLFLWTFAKEFGVLVAFAVFYGVSIGGFTSLLPVLLADLFGLEKLATVTGLLNVALGITCLIGTPIAAVIITQTGSYVPAIIYSGVMILAGALGVAVVHFQQRPIGLMRRNKLVV